jgi:hypothetical protein
MGTAPLPPNATPDSIQPNEIENLRNEVESGFVAIRREIQQTVQQARLDRADREANYMRNWLAILTFTVTVAFVVFGVMGYSRYSDIQTSRAQIAAEAKEITEQENSVSNNAKKVADTAGAVKEVMGNLTDKVADLQTQMNAIESRSQKVDAQLSSAVNHTNALEQQNRFDLKTSLGSPASALGLPIILHVTLAGRSSVSAIDGLNFGDSPGQIYISFLGGSPWLAGSDFTQSLQRPPEVELQPSSIQKWDNTNIQFELSGEDIAAINKIAPNFEPQSGSGIVPMIQPEITIRVVTKEGVSSISSDVFSFKPLQ